MSKDTQTTDKTPEKPPEPEANTTQPSTTEANDQVESFHLKLGVGDFITGVARRGSLDSRETLQLGSAAMQVGTALHTRIQDRQVETGRFKKEVAVKTELRSGPLSIRLSGRIDGVWSLDSKVKKESKDAEKTIKTVGYGIEEIKSSQNVDRLYSQLKHNPLHPYILQTQVYAWLFTRNLKDFDIEHQRLETKIRLVCMHTFKERLLNVPYDVQAIEEWIDQQSAAWLHEERWQRRRRQERQKTAEVLHFPFPHPRPGQVQLMEQVRDSLENQRTLLLQAPTGLGKTAGALFPSLQKALAEGKRLFYTTSRNAQHRLAEEALDRLREQGEHLQSVTLMAKEKMCMMDEVRCQPHYCPYADRYYDKLLETKLLDRLAEEGALTSERFFALAAAEEVCPFELSLDAAKRADIVICDYNYALAPKAQLQRFFEHPKSASKQLLLVDEAHNLFERSLGWFSPSLASTTLRRLAEESTSLSVEQTKQVKELTHALLELVLSYHGPNRLVKLDKEAFWRLEQRIQESLRQIYVDQNQDVSIKEPIVILSRMVGDFCEVMQTEKSSMFAVWQPHDRQKGEGRLQWVCADASSYLGEQLARMGGVIMFSATMKPFDMHLSLCGLAEQEVDTLELPSPYSKDHRKILIVPQVSTFWKRRQQEAPRIASVIYRLAAVKKGNYFVFFSSYSFLEQVLEQMPSVEQKHNGPAFEYLAQPRGAKVTEVSAIERKLHKNRNIILFCVQGGAFSEGIDLPGDQLIGCFIIGPPLPPFNAERQALQDYYEQHYQQGEAFAYTYPAMSRVAQSAGRLIRSAKDVGSIVLIDPRFLKPAYTACMPEDWFDQSPYELVSQQLISDLTSFWEQCYPNRPET